MSENWKIQASVKIGEDMINLRAENSAEAEAIFEWATTKAADLQALVAAVKGVNAVAKALPVQSVQVQPEQGGWQNQQAAPPQFAQAQQAAQGGGAPAPSCRHGERQYREGVGKASGKPYKAYFCPSRDRNDQCDAQFIR